MDEGIIYEVEVFFVDFDKHTKKMEVCYKKEKGAVEGPMLTIDKSCFENGEKDFKDYEDMMTKQMLEKGFINLDEDLNKLLKEYRKNKNKGV